MWHYIISASIASLTALVIAFVAYPWQKKKDRDLKIHSEKLAAYQHFIRELTEFHIMTATKNFVKGDTDALTSRYPQAMAASYALIFYAPKDVIVKSQLYVDALFDLFSFSLQRLRKEEILDDSHLARMEELFDATSKARRAAVLAIRKDVNDELESASEEAINAFFINTPRDGEDK